MDEEEINLLLGRVKKEREWATLGFSFFSAAVNAVGQSEAASVCCFLLDINGVSLPSRWSPVCDGGSWPLTFDVVTPTCFLGLAAPTR